MKENFKEVFESFLQTEDVEKQKYLYDLIRGFVIYLIYRYVGFGIDKQDLEDLVSTAFLRLIESYKKYYNSGINNSNFLSFAYSVVRNVISSYVYDFNKKKKEVELQEFTKISTTSPVFNVPFLLVNSSILNRVLEFFSYDFVNFNPLGGWFLEKEEGLVYVTNVSFDFIFLTFVGKSDLKLKYVDLISTHFLLGSYSLLFFYLFSDILSLTDRKMSTLIQSSYRVHDSLLTNKPFDLESSSYKLVKEVYDFLKPKVKIDKFYIPFENF